MSAKPSMSTALEVDEGYNQFERQIRDRITGLAGPLFETDATAEALWDAYLSNIQEDRRQHYNCHCCRRFVQRYGGLVAIDASGIATPALWQLDVSRFFEQAVGELGVRCARSKVTGVFLSSETVWGTPQTGDWNHLSGTPAKVYHDRVKTAGQAMAERREEYAMLCRGLADYSADVVRQAVRVLKSDTVTRAEKAMGVAEWLLKLHESIADVKGPRRNNVIWLAVATAPPGFCHVRTTVISTLLDDIVTGLPFDGIARRWAEKMHPLQYQRPTAAPSAGAIEQAERLVEQLGVAPSLDRRFARLDDVLSTLWRPPTPLPEPTRKPGGVFSHLRPDKQPIREVELPAVAMTFEKFRRDVLPNAVHLEVLLPSYGSYYGLVTATNPDAPAIIQWDGIEGQPRNPVSWYFYANGSTAGAWGMIENTWGRVTAVFLSPHQWQAPERFGHQGGHAFFALDGCTDSRDASLCLFPEILKSEFHGIRSVIESHNRTAKITGASEGNANGLAFQKGQGVPVTVRAKTSGGTVTCRLDRWE